MKPQPSHSSLNTASLSHALATHMNWSKDNSRRFIQSLFDYIQSEMSQLNRLVFSGFGTFKLNKRKSRRLLHPITQEPYTVPSHYSPHFSPSETLVHNINTPQ